MTKFNKKAVHEAATEAGLDDNKPIIATGVKGMKSTSFRKKFRNMAAYDKWTDSDAFDDFDVQRIFNEGTTTNEAANDPVELNPNKVIIATGFMGPKRVKFRKKFRNMTYLNRWIDSDAFGAFDLVDVVNEGTKVKPTTKNNEADKYRVTAKSNDDDKGFSSGIKSKADADTMATKMKKAKRKDGAKMYNSVKLVKESKLTEGVLDDMDDDGFMAKRQLYDLAKYSVELHRMIQDTDNLEPWIQAKITTAADYIDTVKHYLSYKDIDNADNMADEVGLDDIADVDASIGAMAPEMPIEEVTEFGGDDATLSGDDIMRMMVSHEIISHDMYNTPGDDLITAAGEFATDLGPMYELDSSDVTLLMQEFVQNYLDSGFVPDGERAHVYESEKKARSIYKKMLSGLQRKT